MQSLFQYHRIRREVQLDLESLERNPPPESVSPSRNSVQGEKENTPRADIPGDDVAQVKHIDAKSSALPPGVKLSAPTQDGNVYFIVSWKDGDANNPYNWTLTKKWMAMVTCCVLAISITLVSSVEGPTTEAFDEYYGVNPMAGSTATTGESNGSL